jgi:hypothetical protein
MSVASRLGSHEPDAADIQGIGVVDFNRDRVWITQRLATRRTTTDAVSRSGVGQRAVTKGFHAILNRVVGGEFLYEGGARWRKARRGWRGPSGRVEEAKDPGHPLFLLESVSESDMELVQGEEGQIRETKVKAYTIDLSPDMFRAAVWPSLARVERVPGDRSENQRRKARQSVGGIVCVDAHLRIRRIGFEAVANSDGSALWQITDFWDFGAEVDQWPLLAKASRSGSM